MMMVIHLPGLVTHAIANATGVWFKDLPITREKVLKAIHQEKAVGESVPMQGGFPCAHRVW